MSNIVKFPGQEDQPKGSELLREMADFLEGFEKEGMDAEVAAVALVDGLPAPVIGKNCVTGNDGAITMFNVGATALTMLYLGMVEGGEDNDGGTVH